jgi:uncharacterized protein (TIGR03083 family)
VAQLLTHLGHIYDWATRNLAAAPDERVRMGPMPESPTGAEECAAALDTLVTTLRTTAAATECAGPLTARTAAWWARRQLLETVIHRWDVEHAVGRPSLIDAEVAALGVGEFVEVFAAGVALPVAIRATDDEVLLVLWGRVALDEASVDGDPEAYRAWRAAIAT